ncbi:hypothetical protein [Superficieibacter sp.]|uniref:hypothetical protein n=1 Tax=Superficieibacter sp. TaxID=2303322 RepID=UPI0028A5DFD9|nr:hypothetical protein [Superficieibacter sp.]
MRTSKKTDVGRAADDQDHLNEKAVKPGFVSVQPLRRFMDGTTFRSPTDDAFTVTRQRAAELAANGLVVIVTDVTENKMNPQPDSKG